MVLGGSQEGADRLVSDGCKFHTRVQFESVTRSVISIVFRTNLRP